MSGGAASGDESSTQAPSKYCAFISYRHADKAWGDWLHRSLETYRVPRGLVGSPTAEGVVPPRLGRVFRDREELSAAHDLSTEIQQALRQSASLVVLCSPGAAQSKWVNEEILSYKRLGRTHRIFAIIVAGEPNAADPAQECFPPALKYELGPDGELTGRLAEPIAADAREHADGRDNARLKLIAGLLGVDFDQLRRRQLEAERRAFRRFIAVASSLAIIFAALAAAAGWFYLDAERQRTEALKQRDRAEAAVDSARGVGERLTRNLVQRMRDTEGVQAKVLQEILAEVRRLMDELAAGGDLGNDEKVSAAWTLCELVESKIETGDLAGALADAHGCIAGLEAVAAVEPDMPLLQRRIGMGYERRGEARLMTDDPAGAGADYASGLAVIERIAGRSPENIQAQRDLGRLHIKLGRVRARLGDSAGALREYEAGRDIVARLAAASPENEKLQEQLAYTHDHVGVAQQGSNNLAGAETSFRAGLDIRLALAAGHPGDTDIQLGLALSHSQVGDVQLAREDAAGALGNYQAALAICERLTRADPTNVGFRDSMAIAHLQMGDAQLKLKDYPGAVASFEASMLVRAALCTVDPANSQCRRSLSVVHMRLGDAHFQFSNRPRALQEYRAGLSITRELVAAAPDNSSYQHDLYFCHWRMTMLLEREAGPREALVHARAARDALAPLVDQQPSNTSWRAELTELDAKIAELEARQAGQQ